MASEPSARSESAARWSCSRGSGAATTCSPALLSFGQDPRWRRAMVDAVRRRADRPRPRRRDRDGPRRARAGAPLRVLGRRPRPERRDARRGAARARRPARARRADRAGPGRGRAAAVRRRASSTTSPSPTCCATSTTRRATLAELARVVKPGGRIASLEFGLPDPPLWRPLWWLYTRVGLPALGRRSAATGTRSAASSDRASRAVRALAARAPGSSCGSAAGISRRRASAA